LGTLGVVALAVGIAFVGLRGGGPAGENAAPSAAIASSAAAPSAAQSALPASAPSAGPSSVPSSAPSIRPGVTFRVVAPTPGLSFMTYHVRSGDYFSKIASQFNLQLWELELANPQISDFNHIEVGQVINIPPAGLMTPRPS
jgi:LysM repeat protein